MWTPMGSWRFALELHEDSGAVSGTVYNSGFLQHASPDSVSLSGSSKYSPASDISVRRRQWPHDRLDRPRR